MKMKWLIFISILLITLSLSISTERCSDNMGIWYKHLKDCVIEPTLKHIGMYSPAATELLLGTIAHESLGGFYLQQYPSGIAKGIFQMEPETIQDLWENWLRRKRNLRQQLGIEMPDIKRLMWDLRYATIWARLNYYRVKEPLPEVKDIKGLAEYWHKYWCRGCKGTVNKWVKDYKFYKGND